MPKKTDIAKMAPQVGGGDKCSRLCCNGSPLRSGTKEKTARNIKINQKYIVKLNFKYYD